MDSNTNTHTNIQRLFKIQIEKRFVSDEKLQEYHFDVAWSVKHELILEEVSEQKAEMLQKALNELTPRQNSNVLCPL